MIDTAHKNIDGSVASSIRLMKEQKRAIIARYARATDLQGLTQVLTTLAPLAALWYAAVLTVDISYWITAAITLLMALFLLRVFSLLHECGHHSLFRTRRLNSAFGFLFGVISGMPQLVWSQHHAYHHATNGNWDKYRGPLTTATVEEFAAMTPAEQRHYERSRHIWLAPFAGFVYLIFNPRFTWMKGCAALALHVIKGKLAAPRVSMKDHAAGFQTRYWTSPEQLRHMTWNNLVLLSAWAVMAWIVGPALFFIVYIVSTSIAGGLGLMLFTVQHNFEHAYATTDDGWDRDAAAIEGTSFLVLPGWLNWFTADIAYHHVHHLSAKIPNYHLARCHRDYEHLFDGVTRVRLSRIPAALKYILWDTRSRRIISIAEYKASTGV